MQVQCLGHIQTASRGEQTEARAYARIHIHDLVSAIAQVVPVADVQNTAIADRSHEFPRQVVDFLIQQTDAQAGDAGFGRKAPDLLGGDAEPALRVVIKETIEHPVLPRNELLDEEVGTLPIPCSVEQLQQIGAMVNDEFRAASAGTETFGIGRFDHERKGGIPGKEFETFAAMRR